MRAGLRLAILGCLLGAGLVLLALSRVWIDYELTAQAPLPSRRVELTGSSLVPGGRALALLGLAAVAGLLATRTWGRQVVGGVVLLAGACLAVVVGRALLDPAGAVARAATESPGVGDAAADVYLAAGSGLGALGPWPFAALVGAVTLMATGVLVTLRSHGWAGLGARYAATEPPGTREVDPWTALDRGEDPTGN